MGKYFGTDGFHGEVNGKLTADHAFKVGRFLGWYYGELKRRSGSDTPARIIIAIGTVGAFLPLFIAHARDPFVSAYRRVAAFPVLAL